MLYSPKSYVARGMRSFGPQGETRKAVPRFAMERSICGSTRVATPRVRAVQGTHEWHFRQDADWLVSESASHLSVRVARSAAPDNLLFAGVASIVRSGAELWHVPISRAESSTRKAAPDAHSQ